MRLTGGHPLGNLPKEVGEPVPTGVARLAALTSAGPVAEENGAGQERDLTDGGGLGARKRTVPAL
jgi:hypothetical protein